MLETDQDLNDQKLVEYLSTPRPDFHVWEYCILVWRTHDVRLCYLSQSAKQRWLEVEKDGRRTEAAMQRAVARLGAGGWEICASQIFDFRPDEIGTLDKLATPLGIYWNRWLYFKRRVS